jgi:hypothetical protein
MASSHATGIGRPVVAIRTASSDIRAAGFTGFRDPDTTTRTAGLADFAIQGRHLRFSADRTIDTDQ